MIDTESMNPRRAFEQALEFILHEASDRELEVLEQALHRRTGGRNPTNPGEMDFRAMASKITGDLSARFGTPANDQIREMTRNLVANIILTHEPNMPAAHLEELLDQYVPDATRERPGKEIQLPPEAVLLMVKQFVAYGEGRMPASEVNELKREMPNWPNRYWEMFGSATQKLISERLNGRTSDAELMATLTRVLSEGKKG